MGYGRLMPCFCTRVNAGGGAPAPSPLLTDLVEYWDLDEASGTRVGKHAGLDLTDNNTVGSGLGVDGVSTAADFEQSNAETLTRAHEAALSLGSRSFTFAFWVNLESDADSRAITKGDPTASGGEFRFISLGGAFFTFQVRKADNSGAGGPTTTPLSAGAWYFIVAWFDDDTDTAYLSVNNAAPSSHALGQSVYAGTNALSVGTILDGRMQAPGFWKRVLTADERTWLYNSATAARTYAAVAAYTG